MAPGIGLTWLLLIKPRAEQKFRTAPVLSKTSSLKTALDKGTEGDGRKRVELPFLNKMHWCSSAAWLWALKYEEREHSTEQLPSRHSPAPSLCPQENPVASEAAALDPKVHPSNPALL